MVQNIYSQYMGTSYLALEIEQFKRFALPIYKFVSNYNFLKDIVFDLYMNRVIILLAFGLLYQQYCSCLDII